MEQVEQKMRTEFLTILCVLSIIGSSIGILSGINQYREADLATALLREQMKGQRSQMKENASKGGKEAVDMAEKIMNTTLDSLKPEKTRAFALVSIISNVITLIGASLMYTLRKPGFWIYVLGTLVLVIAPFQIYGSGNMFSYGISIFFGFIGLLFIILYSRNLKHMR